MRLREGEEPDWNNYPAPASRRRRRWLIPTTLGGLGLAAVGYFGLQPSDEASSPAPGPDTFVSKTILVEVSMGGDGSIDLTDHTTHPFAIDLNFTDCKPGTIPDIPRDDATKRNSRALELLNAMMEAQTEVIEEPEKLGIQCDTLSAEMPDDVVVKMFPDTGGRMESLMTFQRSETGFAMYERRYGPPLNRTVRLEFEEYINPQYS